MNQNVELPQTKTDEKPLKEERMNTHIGDTKKQISIINKIKIPITSEITGRTYHLQLQETKKGFYLIIDDVWTPYINLYKSQ